MFTSETQFNHTLVTVVDDLDNYQDLCVKLYDSHVEIYQWDDTRGEYRIITISTKMFSEFADSLNNPDGAYITR